MTHTAHTYMKLRQNCEIPNFSLFTMINSLLKDAKFSFEF